MDRKTTRAIAEWKGWLADLRPRALSRQTRYLYLRRIYVTAELAEGLGFNLMTADRVGLGKILVKVPGSSSSQNVTICAWRHFFKFLMEQGQRKDNPAADIEGPPAPRGNPRPLDHEAAQAYLDAATRLSPEHEVIACLGLYVGLRRFEIAKVQWQHIFYYRDRWWLKVVEGKGGKDAELPLNQRAKEAVDRLRAEHSDPEWLFPSPVRARAHLSLPWFRERHIETCRAAKLTDCPTLHQLRHTFATLLLDSGADLATTSELLRHSNWRSTQVYVLVRPERQVQAVDRLDLSHPTTVG